VPIIGLLTLALVATPAAAEAPKKRTYYLLAPLDVRVIGGGRCGCKSTKRSIGKWRWM
jgi:hypothetical protein